MAQGEQQDRLQRLRRARTSGATRQEYNYVPQTTSDGYAYAAPGPVPGSGHGGSLAALLLLLLIAAAGIGGVTYVVHSFHSSAGGPLRKVQFVVKPGETLDQISGQLQDDGLVSSKWLFQLYYRINGGSESIHAGAHALNTGMSMDQIAGQLQQVPQVLPKVAPVASPYHPFNFLPGKRAEEIGDLLQKYHVITEAAFMHEVRYGKFNYWFLKSRPAGASLEGFLYPGEYMLKTKDSPHRVVGLMLAAFNHMFTSAMHAEAARAHRNVFTIVTMASIVERETQRPKDRPYVAGVYYNRLKNVTEVALRLQSDPTVQYAMGYRPAEHSWWEKNPSLIDTTINSPYNTYQVQGLPPGPISNPSRSSILAALRPANSNFLYFKVESRDGGKTFHTYFCDTNVCQNNDQGVRIK